MFTKEFKFEKYFYKHPELKDDEVRIRVLSAGLCMSDSHFSRGHWGKKDYYPLCPGHEVVGEVEALGKNVDKFKVGEKVMMGPFRDSCMKCEFCLKGWTNACVGLENKFRWIYDYYWGGYSTHCQHPQSHVFKLPDKVDYKKIAPLMCAGITTFLPLHQNVKKGDKVAIIGAGGLGHFAI